MKRQALVALVAGMGVVAPAAAAPALACILQVPQRLVQGQAVMLQFTLTNTGTEALWVLRWNTPWEGRWLAPFARLERDGQPLDYQGAMVKRAAPDAASYLALAPGQTLPASLALAPAFDLRRAGRYRVQPAIILGDVQVQDAGAGPRLGLPWNSIGLDCGAVHFELQAKPQSPPR